MTKNKTEKPTHTPGALYVVTGSNPDLKTIVALGGGFVESASDYPIARDVRPEFADMFAAAPTMKDAMIRIRKALNQNPKAAEDALRDDPQAWDALLAAIESAGGL